MWLLALQQAGAERHGLGFFRSDDEGNTWRYAAPIQDDSTHHDTADLLAVGADVALVYSYEDSVLAGSTRHDVWFQWWHYHAEVHDWVPSPAVRVFDSTSDTTAYSRAELARDSRGRLWVQAFRMEADGTHTAVLALSEDEGHTFTPQPSLAHLPQRGGGRLLHLGDRLIFLYGHHGVAPARFRVHLDSALPGLWTSEQLAFPEGLYHGAALSAVSPGEGRMHLVYKDLNQHLSYRFFDGAAFGPPIPLETSGDWALQPALALVGDELVIFDNQPVALNTQYQLVARVLADGSVGPPQVLENTPRFRGYLTTPERLPGSLPRVPCIYGETTDASTSGVAAMTALERTPTPPGPALQVVFTNTTHRLLTVTPSGTAYALQQSDATNHLYVSTDGARTWSYKGHTPLGGSFRLVSALADGTLLADIQRGGNDYLGRSSDGGATWTEVLSLGAYRLLTPRNVAELDGTVYLLEYQAFTTQDTPIQLYASTDRGRTWQVRQTFMGHRHGHGLAADAAHHALWALFGDTTLQSGIFRSTDAGHSWRQLLGGQQGCVVTATVLSDGSLFFGQDISWLPERPHIAQLSPNGTYVELELLTGPAYSSLGLHAGGFVVGSAREPDGDIYPPSEVSAHVWVSHDGVDWKDSLQYPRLSATDTVRADVYDALPSGLLVLRLENAQGFGPGGVGYQLVRFIRP